MHFAQALAHGQCTSSYRGRGWPLRGAICLRPGPAGRVWPEPRPVGSWAGARDREPAKSSQYLLLLYLLAVWLDPEGPPELLSCSEALGRSPSLQWPHLPAPQSNQPAAGRGERGSQESVSGQGRGGSYIQVLTCLPELGCGGRKCMGLE